MSEQLGAVVVGTGFGVLTHLRALRKAGFDVKALVGRDGEKARKRAELDFLRAQLRQLGIMSE